LSDWRLQVRRKKPGGSVFFGFYPVAAVRSGCGAIDPEE